VVDKKAGYKAQQGTKDQMPRGEAQQLNEALATVQEAGPVQAAQVESPPEQASPADYEPQYTPETDGEQFITGPTLRPDEPVTTGTVSPTGGMPEHLKNVLPVFEDAASRPDAPPQLKLLVQLMQRYK
jgi:hypothetical protein